jgi:3-deoxy-D-manno-octulosonic-acid transferase
VIALNLLYLLVGIAALPWVLWRRLSGKRPVAAIRERLTGRVRVADCPEDHCRIWLHGVSVGEVQLIRPLVNELQNQADLRNQLIDCVVSSSTTTGLEVATKTYEKDHVFPCPLDFSWAVKQIFSRVRPDVIVLAELEIWPNLLRIAEDCKIPVVVVNGRMSERSYQGYKRLGRIASLMVQRISLVLSRSQEDSDRFTSLGARRVETIGSLKFDGIHGDERDNEIRQLRKITGIDRNDLVFIAGSTQEPEESLAVETFLQQQKVHPALKLILVPRHVERTREIAAWLTLRLQHPDACHIPWYFRSRLSDQGSQLSEKSFILLVDVTGELAAWWGLATVAFVGGSLDGLRGGQNMLEPAAYGVAVCFGPYTRNFRAEVSELLGAEAAIVVHDGVELTRFVTQCLIDPVFSKKIGTCAKKLIEKNQGGTKLTALRILDFLPVI